MQSSRLRSITVWVLLALPCSAAFGADGDENQNSSSLVARNNPSNYLYRLGAGDEIKVQQLNAEELDGKTVRIDDTGFVTLPLVGRLKLSGLTVDDAETLVKSKLTSLLLNPDPIIFVSEYRSQPVSVIGAVNTPGVVQLQGAKTLMEVLSMAGGLRPDAGSIVEIQRLLVNGRVPGGRESLDPSNQYSMSKIDVGKLLNGENPSDNVVIRPHDLITVPHAGVVYVIGDVHKPGGFPLTTGGDISVLQAVSLAEGLGPQASPKSARILRFRGDGSQRDEIPVNVASIMAGKANDVTLQPRDILLIPDSKSKKAGVRAAEAAVQVATGIAIWGRIP